MLAFWTPPLNDKGASGRTHVPGAAQTGGGHCSGLSWNNFQMSQVKEWVVDPGFLQLCILQDIPFQMKRKLVNPLCAPTSFIVLGVSQAHGYLYRGCTLNGGRHEGNLSGQSTRDQILSRHSRQGQERNVLPPERSNSHRASPGRYRWRGRAHDHFRKLGKPVCL